MLRCILSSHEKIAALNRYIHEKENHESLKSYLSSKRRAQQQPSIDSNLIE